MTHGSLFSGIGGFDLGFERAGIETTWEVEIDPYCRKVLERHFPNAKRYEDVRTVGKHNLAPVDIISGGFPCQDISNAGKRAGIDGERSGLWSEYFRIICELRPRIVVVENVAALLGRGMGRVLGDLASRGYDAEWQSIRASDVGAPHRRERIWIVAYPSESGSRNAFDNSGSNVADADECGLQGQWPGRQQVLVTRPGEGEFKGFGDGGREQWAVEPNVGRVAHGIPKRVDRLKGLGNAIVPQIAEWIGQRLMEVGA